MFYNFDDKLSIQYASAPYVVLVLCNTFVSYRMDIFEIICLYEYDKTVLIGYQIDLTIRRFRYFDRSH